MNVPAVTGFLFGVGSVAVFWLERHAEVDKQKTRKHFYKERLDMEKIQRTNAESRLQSVSSQLKECHTKIAEKNGFTSEAKETVAKALSAEIAGEIVSVMNSKKIPEGPRKRKEKIADQITGRVEKWINEELAVNGDVKKIESSFILESGCNSHPISDIYGDYIYFPSAKEKGMMMKKKITVTPNSAKLH